VRGEVTHAEPNDPSLFVKGFVSHVMEHRDDLVGRFAERQHDPQRVSMRPTRAPCSTPTLSVE
jgi:hypothetical protein